MAKRHQGGDLKSRLLRRAPVNGQGTAFTMQGEQIILAPLTAGQLERVALNADKTALEQFPVALDIFMEIVCDPKTGLPIFSAEDRDDLLAVMPAGVVNDALAAAAGFNVGDAKKNSKAATSGG